MSISESRPVVDGDDVPMRDDSQGDARQDHHHVTRNGDHMNVTSEPRTTAKSPIHNQKQQLPLAPGSGENGTAQENGEKGKAGESHGNTCEDSGKGEKALAIENGKSENVLVNSTEERNGSNGHIEVNGNGADSGNSTRVASPKEIPPNSQLPSITPHDPAHATAPPARTNSESIKGDKEQARLEEVLSQTSPAIAQQVLRDQWRALLFTGYDEIHISFLLRCLLKNSNHAILDRIKRDDSLFKGPLLETAVTKLPVVSKVLNNATSTQLHNYVPQDVLDAAFQSRLETIDGRTLLNWLAAHRRLGYEDKDIIDGHDESVFSVLSPGVPTQEDIHMTNVPTSNSYPPPMTHHNPPAARQPVVDHQVGQPQQHQEQQLRPRSQPQPHPPNSMVCPYCQRHFKDRSGYNYHVHKKVCDKEPPEGKWKWMCALCAQGFTTKQGRDYHELKGVCRECDIAPATAPTYHIPPVGGVSNQSIPPQTSFSAAPFTQQPFPSQLLENSQAPIMQARQAQQPVQPQAMPQSQPTIQPQPTQQARAPGAVSIPRPPLHTPFGRSKRGPPPDIRQSPSQLPPERLAALNREIEEEDQRYEKAVAEANQTRDAVERDQRLVSLKNGNASKKSQIRKRYGVSLRLREKDKLAMKPSIHKTRIEKFRAPETPSTSTPRASNPQVVIPTTGFSPINAPHRSSSSPVNAPRRSSTAPTVAAQLSNNNSPVTVPRQSGPSPVNVYGSPYPPPPPPSSRPQVSSYQPSSASPAEVPVHRQTTQNAPSDHAHPVDPPPQAFGVMVPMSSASQPRYMAQNQATTTTYGKRRREDDDNGHNPRSPSRPSTFDAILYQGPPPKRPATSTSPSSTPSQHSHAKDGSKVLTSIESKTEPTQNMNGAGTPPRADARSSGSTAIDTEISNTQGQDMGMKDAGPPKAPVSNSAPTPKENNGAVRDTATNKDAEKRDTGLRVEEGIMIVSSDSE